MDAYSSYILQLSEARAGDLRREAAEYALSRAARGQRTSRWSRFLTGLGRRTPAPKPVAPVPLPTPRSEAELRRSA